jgi:hypothetical protein
LVQFGLVVFGTNGTCPIPSGFKPVRPALNNLSAVEMSMPNVQPGQFTPTGPALDWVYENMIEEYAPDGPTGPQIVILATDGEPNSCDGGGGGRRGANYTPSLNAVRKGTGKGVTTYVISLADATGAFHDHLQELADLGNPAAGGNAQLYEPSSPAELSEALQTLVGGAVGCDIVLDGSLMPGAECEGVVQVNGTKVACNDPNGYTVTDPHHIRLQGNSCRLLMDTRAVVEARFPCSSLSPDCSRSISRREQKKLREDSRSALSRVVMSPSSADGVRRSTITPCFCCRRRGRRARSITPRLKSPGGMISWWPRAPASEGPSPRVGGRSAQARQPDLRLLERPVGSRVGALDRW